GKADSWARTDRRARERRPAPKESALNPQMLCRCFTPVRDFLVFNDLSFIEPAETGSLDCRDVDKHILAAALRLNKSAPFLRIEPLHGAFRHICSDGISFYSANNNTPKTEGQPKPPIAHH